MIPLFEKLPYVSLDEFPTPLQTLDQPGRQISLDNLFIKRDDFSGKVYGETR